MQVVIGRDGTIRFIDKPDLASLKEEGVATTRRASHVEPVNRLARFLFHLIRKRVADESRAAQFTRIWPCTWRARIFDGPTLGPYRNRQEAIDAEVEWLESNGIPS